MSLASGPGTGSSQHAEAGKGRVLSNGVAASIAQGKQRSPACGASRAHGTCARQAQPLGCNAEQKVSKAYQARVPALMRRGVATVEVFDAAERNLAPQKRGAPAIASQPFQRCMARTGRQTETAPRATRARNWDTSGSPSKKSEKLPAMPCLSGATRIKHFNQELTEVNRQYQEVREKS